MFRRAFVVGCLVVAGASWLVTPAYAYLDPGTGSMLLQALIGGIAAAGAFGSLYFGKLKALFTGKKEERRKAEIASSEDDLR